MCACPKQQIKKAVNIWFNEAKKPTKKNRDMVPLESRWQKQSSLSRVVVIHAAGADTKERSPFADWTYFLMTVTELRTIHIEPVFKTKPASDRFKFKLSGMRAC